MTQASFPTRSDRFVTTIDRELQRFNGSPIDGYQNLTVKTLEEALELITLDLPNLLNHIRTAKQECNQFLNVLTQDESAAIYLYTMDTPLYSALNSALRDENRVALKTWFPFLKLFITALEKLPSLQSIVWRGVAGDVGSNFIENDVKTWWSVTSCSKANNVVEMFLSDKGTVFSIEAVHAKDISQYSAFLQEKEAILMPGTRVRIKNPPLVFKESLFIVSLEEQIIQKQESEK